MERRDFLKVLGLTSSVAIVPQKIIASTVPENTNLSKLLGHDFNITPKKIITSLDDISANKVASVSKNEIALAKRLQFMENFHVLKRVAHKSDRNVFMYNKHTGETINLVFFSEGKYISENINKINYFMRDHRENKVKNMDLDIIEGIYQVSQHTKKGVPLVLTSGYRTPKTNRRVGGAKRSTHMEAKAIDFSRDKKDHTSLYKIKRFLVAHHNGGVGYYPRSGFIHIDAGAKRNWRG